VQQKRPAKQVLKPVKPRQKPPGARVATLADVPTQNQGSRECGIAPNASRSETIAAPSQIQAQPQTNFSSVGRTLDGNTVAPPIQGNTVSQSSVMDQVSNDDRSNHGFKQHAQVVNNAAVASRGTMRPEMGQAAQAALQNNSVFVRCSRACPSLGTRGSPPNLHRGHHHLGPRVTHFVGMPQEFTVCYPMNAGELAVLSSSQLQKVIAFCSKDIFSTTLPARQQDRPLQDFYDQGLISLDEAIRFDGVLRSTLDMIGGGTEMPLAPRTGRSFGGGRRLD
jgi:hypothetical protein